MKLLKRKNHPTWLFLVLLAILIAVTACQSDKAAPTLATSTGESKEVDQPVETAPENLPGSGNPPQKIDPSPVPEGAAPAAAVEPDPAAIEAAWQSSPHAAAFVQDANGNNNRCARCHAPVNWAPTMDDLPESCYACKFELKQPPAYIPEDQWVSIPCNVCHEPDKKGNIQPEIQWLEIAALEEYAPVGTTTELCLKCHNPVNLPEHGTVQLVNAHAGYECTDCHDAHDATASCGGVDCHENALVPAVNIPGHDEDHLNVACAACHDGSGAQVGPIEESGTWTTFLPWSYETSSTESETQVETGVVAFSSHNLVLEASCERCHYAENPWDLSVNVQSP